MSAAANQPTWERRPTERGWKGGWTLTRCPTKGTLEVLILSHDIVGHLTHYWNGRTRPCGGDTCEPCNHGHRSRWHGYFAGLNLRTNEKVIVEVTATVAEYLAEAFNRERTLKGMTLRLWRRSARANAKIVANITPKTAATGELADAPDIRPIMERVWEVNSRLATQLDPQIETLRKAAGAETLNIDGTRPEELD